ncbi:hypothetical protein LOTGIDRAFT_238763 [Lottia gigantea]|uniref:CTCK domain-containing protein n=1 Tax=Lottia gigantea TaxID=225164 RepID=V4AXA4_LOTGI|nr:hypothetical protein LOTGIDRAFT_238763 [Lottia gigantea]ESO99690.1 hypothetical protein LOTGIDRAFT_238763 [Lottia gigantea]
MIKILLIAALVVACNALSKVQVSPICTSKAPVEALAAPAAARSSKAKLTEEEAVKLLGVNSVGGAKVKRSAVKGAAEARAALSKASGSIILPIPWKPNPCPPLLTTTFAGQDLCPSYSQLLTQFPSSNGNGYCYVLYPKWQRIYETFCKCKACRNSCPFSIFTKPGSIRFRNYCKPKYRRTRYVWAICISKNHFQCLRERVTYSSGGCECRAYRTC